MNSTVTHGVDRTFAEIVQGVSVPQPRRAPDSGGEWTIWAQHARRQARRAAR